MQTESDTSSERGSLEGMEENEIKLQESIEPISENQSLTDGTDPHQSVGRPQEDTD